MLRDLLLLIKIALIISWRGYLCPETLGHAWIVLSCCARCSTTTNSIRCVYAILRIEVSWWLCSSLMMLIYGVKTLFARHMQAVGSLHLWLLDLLLPLNGTWQKWGTMPCVGEIRVYIAINL